jgi:hypothetical protein
LARIFAAEHEAVLTARGIDTRGIERAPGLSFHWTGAYAGNLNEAQTLGTDLNVFERFEPKIPEAYKDSEYLFLANIDPVLQARVRSQMPNVRMVCGDTMNYWISTMRQPCQGAARAGCAADQRWRGADAVGRDECSVRAAEKVLAMGPKSLVVKHGEYGATAFFGERSFPGGAQRPRGRFARRRCRWPRWSIRPARAIRSRAASMATSRRSRS